MNLAEWLKGLGLGQYADAFAEILISVFSKTCFSRVYLNEAEARPIPTRAGMGKRYASAPASCGTEAGASAGFFGSSAAETASSTRSSQMNSISRRATSGMSS